MKEETNIVLANRSRSLRTTIPSSIVRSLGLEAGDRIEWKLEPDGKAFAVKISFQQEERAG